MPVSKPHILYVGSVLPKRSETFVYREVLGLRNRGVQVSIASVNVPERDLGDEKLDQLGAEAIHVYGHGLGGKWKVLIDAVKQRGAWVPRGMLENRPGYWPKYKLQYAAGIALARRVRKRFAQNPVTHVHAHMAHVPTTVAMSCAEALGVPFSFTGHAADLFRDRSALKTKLKRAAFVSCISEWHRGFYRELVPGSSLTDERLPVIRCGVDMDEFTPADPEAAPAGSLLAVGRLVPKKGFDVLIRALAAAGADDGTAATLSDSPPLREGPGEGVDSQEHLDGASPHAAAAPSPQPYPSRERGPENQPLRLTLVGDGPEEARLRALADDLGVTDRVTFAGAQPNHRVREMMGSASMFVLPCQEAADGDRDGIPVVLMEAMARQICVVSGDLETIRELVADNVTGVMVRPGSVDELSEVLLRLSRDGAERKRLAEAGRARVAEEFSLSVNLDRLEAAFAAASEEASSSENYPVSPVPDALPGAGANHA